MKTQRICDCGADAANQSMRCSPCRRVHYFVKDILSGRTRAQAEVAKAKKHGQLQSATDFQCADCGVPAIEYDHRDYDKPLDVAPVCRRCNILRKSAKPSTRPLHHLERHIRSHPFQLRYKAFEATPWIKNPLAVIPVDLWPNVAAILGRPLTTPVAPKRRAADKATA